MNERITELAHSIAAQAEAIADGTVVGPVLGAIARLEGNVATLKAWAELETTGEREPFWADQSTPLSPLESAMLNRPRFS